MTLRNGVLLLAALLAGCTGENVDEDFVAEHGALLARVECTGLMPPNNDYRVHYSALMFLDGSVMASATERISSTVAAGTAFFERSDANRFNASVVVNPADPGEACGTGSAVHYTMESGDLQRCFCTGMSFDCNDSVLSVDTDCSGFNKTLFD